jgi:hypothetical protein
MNETKANRASTKRSMVWIFPALMTLTGQQRLSWRINDVIMGKFGILRWGSSGQDCMRWCSQNEMRKSVLKEWVIQHSG